MMEVKKYIISKLEELAKDFPAIQIVYAYNQYAETHIVQLTPQNEYYNNDALDNAWIEIVKDFQHSFPFENISFVSDDSDLISVAPEFEYNSVNDLSKSWNGLIDSMFYEFKKYKTSFEIEFTIGLLETQKCTFGGNNIVTIESTNLNTDVTNNPNAGEYSFAMAA